MPYKYKELTSIVFSTIHSEGTAVVLVINTLLHDIAFSVTLSAFSQTVYMLLRAYLTLQHVSTIHSFFSSQLITSNFSSILIIFCQFFTWIVLGNVDIHFSLILVTKASADERETMSAV
jgi:hypothetical protein